MTTAFATVLGAGELMPATIAIEDVWVPWTLAIRRAAALLRYLAYRATWVSRDELQDRRLDSVVPGARCLAHDHVDVIGCSGWRCSWIRQQQSDDRASDEDNVA